MGTDVIQINDREFAGEITANSPSEVIALLPNQSGLAMVLKRIISDTRNSVLRWRMARSVKQIEQPAYLKAFVPVADGYETHWVKTAAPTVLGA